MNNDFYLIQLPSKRSRTRKAKHYWRDKENGGEWTTQNNAHVYTYLEGTKKMRHLADASGGGGSILTLERVGG